MAKTAKTSRTAKKRTPARRCSTETQGKKIADRKGRKPRHTRETRKPATKAAVVLELVKRDKGVTLAELMKATGWQAHSVRGYLSGTSSFLTLPERERLVLGSRIITLEQGVRFLTDFLAGDVYYGASRPGQNLDRCRTQFKLVESIMRDEEKMERIVERFGER